MQVGKEQAIPFFEQESQQVFEVSPYDLPDHLIYYREGPFLGVFHYSCWPEYWQGHFAVFPAFPRRYIECGKLVLSQFVRDYRPKGIIGYTATDSAPALKLAEKLGFSRKTTLYSEIVVSELDMESI